MKSFAQLYSDYISNGGYGSGRHPMAYEDTEPNTSTANHFTKIADRVNTPTAHKQAAEAHEEAAKEYHPSHPMFKEHNDMAEYHKSWSK